MIKFRQILSLFFCLLASYLSAQSKADSLLYQDFEARIDGFIARNEIDSALMHNSMLIKYYNSIDDLEGILSAAIDRAEMLRSIYNLSEGIQVISEYEGLAKSLIPSALSARFYNRKAAILYQQKKKPEALDAIKKSQALDSIINESTNTYSNWNLEGAVYRDLHQFDKALSLLHKNAQFAEVHGDTLEYLSALYNLALTYSRQGQYAKSIETSLKYIENNTYQSRDYKNGAMWREAAESARKIGKYEEAYNYLDSAHKVRLLDMERLVDFKVDAFKASNQLEKARLKNSVLSEKSKTDHFRILALAFFLLLFIFLGVIFYLSRQRYKSQNQLQAIENAELQEGLDFKNKLISIVAHDIRNPMASIKGMLELYNQGLVKEEELKSWMDGLEVSVANVDLLLENLLNWVRSQSGKIEPYIETLNLNMILEQALQGLDAQVQLKGIKLHKPNPNIAHSVMGDANIIAFVLRNILSNAFKFSPKGSNVFITCYDSNEHHCIEIKDEGEGIPENVLAKIESGLNFSKGGTSKEKGTGMGLALSKEFLAAMNGRMEISSILKQGTTIKVIIPR